MNETEGVKVTIFGTQYTLIDSEGRGEPHIREIAWYVDDKMNEIYDQTRLAASTKVAVLAALDIAEELYEERRTARQVDEGAISRLDTMVDVINTARGSEQ